jgi:hypothetical protein
LLISFNETVRSTDQKKKNNNSNHMFNLFLLKVTSIELLFGWYPVCAGVSVMREEQDQLQLPFNWSLFVAVSAFF